MSYSDEDTDVRTTQERLVATLLSDARKADAIDRERADFLQALVKTPGWKVYLELLNLRIQNFADQVMAPAGSINGMISSEYLKGAMSGVIIARDLPAVIIAAMEQLRPATHEEPE